jgi:hypothetical protein
MQVIWLDTELGHGHKHHQQPTNFCSKRFGAEILDLISSFVWFEECSNKHSSENVDQQKFFRGKVLAAIFEQNSA